MAIVLITGCSSGFGSAAALAFARNGDTVYASMRSTEKGEHLRRAATAESLDIHIEPLDVTRPETFDTMIESVVDRSSRLDVLVNNAGVLRAGAFEDLPPQVLREVMETNFFAPFLLTRAALPFMRRQSGGYIIMISSLSGVAGLPGDVAYTASKFALEGATEALRHEVDRWGIRLALVEAGLYATRMFAANLGAGGALPEGYPLDSPYRPLVEHQIQELRARLASASDPGVIGELLVRISRSDGSQLRWPADEVAKKVLSKLFALDDAARDEFLRDVSGTQWWSAGQDGPGLRTPG